LVEVMLSAGLVLSVNCPSGLKYRLTLNARWEVVDHFVGGQAEQPLPKRRSGARTPQRWRVVEGAVRVQPVLAFDAVGKAPASALG
jgi:hypothetical protein